MEYEIETNCRDCGVDEMWFAVDINVGRQDWQPTNGESSFTCVHWRDHHESSMRATENPSGRASSGPVTARRISRAPQIA